jgi:hypothetical protein
MGSSFGWVVVILLAAIGSFAARPAVATTPTTAPAATAPSSVLPNGSFEHVSGDLPDGWTTGQPERVKVIEENGNHFVRVTIDKPKQTAILSRALAVDPAWKRLTIRARLRAKDLKLGEEGWHEPRVALFFANADGEHVGKWPDVPRLRENTAGWIDREVTVDVPDGAAKLDVQCAVFSAQGVVDFDDVTVSVEE